MKKSALLVTLGLLCFGGSCARTPPGEVPTLTLTLTDKGELKVDPKELTIDPSAPKPITILSSVGKPDCTVEGVDLAAPAKIGDQNCKLERGAKSEAQLLLNLSLNGEPSSTKVTLKVDSAAKPPVIPWLIGLLSFAVAALALLQWQRSARLGAETARAQTAVATQLGSLQDGISRMSGLLPLAPPGFGQSNQNSAAQRSQSQVDLLIVAIGAWCQMVPNTPLEVEKGLRQLRSWQGAPRPPLLADIQGVAKPVVQVALIYTDETLDPQRQTPSVQRVLEALVHAAGFILIEPQPGDAFEPQQQIMGSADPGSHQAATGRVSRVLRRGLKTKEGVVLYKAEVCVYA